jgi:hypothetical protein
MVKRSTRDGRTASHAPLWCIIIQGLGGCLVEGLEEYEAPFFAEITDDLVFGVFAADAVTQEGFDVFERAP